MNHTVKGGIHKHTSLKDLDPASNWLATLNSADELLEIEGDDIPFQEYLNHISPITSADRTYIFLNHIGASGEKLMSYMAEWCNDKTKAEIDNPLLQNLSYDKYLQRWSEIFSEGQLISGPVKSFPDNEREFLEKRGIKSLLMVPLFCCGEFTGFVGFDNCFSEDEWSSRDLEFLKAATSNLSNRIEKNWGLSRMKRENNLFTAVIDAMDVIVYAVDYFSLEVVYMNNYAIEKFGNGLGRKCWNVFHEEKQIPCSFCMKEKLIAADGSFNEPYIWEYYYPKIDQWCMSSSQALKWPNGKTVIFQISTDMTKHKKTEALLEKSIEEKDTLLNEVHHRVKNNLQSLIYLISMQADYVDSSKAVEVLNELRDRVQAMSLVHSQLYESKNLANINFEKYVSELIKTLIRAITTDKIDTCINISNITLDIKTAIPCALILNELVTNIIKHAFKENGNSEVKPEIRISMEKVQDDYVLKVGDNGKGFEMQDDFNNPKSLGLKLINIWATHQLRGTIDRNEDLGVEYIITFPQK
jgi:two-component sensor histidine kinase